MRQAEYIELIAPNVRFRLPCFNGPRSGRQAPPSLRREPVLKFIQCSGGFASKSRNSSRSMLLSEDSAVFFSCTAHMTSRSMARR